MCSDARRIFFSRDEVRDALAGRTRFERGHRKCIVLANLGDRLWVAEDWAQVVWVQRSGRETTRILYAADDPGGSEWRPEEGDRWRSAATMPRRHSRLTIEVVSVEWSPTAQIIGYRLIEAPK